MKRTGLLTILICALCFAGEKKPPQGHGEDDSVAIAATILSPADLNHEVGSDFNDNYLVLQVTVSPKGAKPYQVHLDDFILRSEQSGEHSGPFLNAGQIAGSGALEVERTYANKQSPDSPRLLAGTKVEMKDDAKGSPALPALKKKMLAEATVTEPVSGLMFFPLTKEKPKNLILSCKTPTSHLRLSFK